MAKEKNEFKEIIQGGTDAPAQEPMTFAKVMEGLRNAGGALWDGAKPMFDHGSSELTSAIFNGSAHLPYGWSHAEADQAIEAPKTPEVAPEPQKENEIER